MLHQTLLSSATFNTCPPIFTPSAICYTLYKRYITNEDFSTDIVPYYLFCQLLHLVPRHRHWETFLELGLNNKIRLPFDAVFNHHLLGEDRGTWTLDFKIKSFVLCQLSYILIKYRGFMRNYKYPPRTGFPLNHNAGIVYSPPDLWCEWRDSNPQSNRQGIFLLLYVTIAALLRCSLDFIFTMHFCLGACRQVSTRSSL